MSDPIEEILSSIQLPRIPKFEIVLEAASGEEIRGKIMQTIETCSQRGGGRIVIPPGSFRCNGPIHLKSCIELHFSEGSFLKFSPDPELYLPPVPTRWEGVEIINYSPFIYGSGITDAALTGKGVIAGGPEIFQGWRPLQKEDQERSRCMEEQHVPSGERVFGKGHYLRPALLQLFNSERILLEDLTLTSAPFWMIQPVYCRDITVRRLKLDSMLVNNDGIDLDSCENTLIEDSVFRNGDDAVVIKSGRDQDGIRVGRPTRRAVIRNCVFDEVMHGFAIGSELSGGAEDIYVRNISMNNVFFEAISFKSTTGRGGVIRNISMEDIRVDRAGRHFICIDNDYSGIPHGDALTLFKDISIRNVSCHWAKNAFRLQGKKDRPLENIRIENATVDAADVLYELDEFAQDVRFDRVSVNGQAVTR